METDAGKRRERPSLLGNFTYNSFRKGVLKFTDYERKYAKKEEPNTGQVNRSSIDLMKKITCSKMFTGSSMEASDAAPAETPAF